MNILPIMSEHAQQRWVERFPNLDLAATWSRARIRIGAKMQKRLRQTCPAHVHHLSGQFNGRYLKRTPDFIVFVVAPPETIITVFKVDI